MPPDMGDEMRANFSCGPWALTVWVFLLNVPVFGQTTEFWSGQAQCQTTVQSQGYIHQETQTWALTGGAPTQQGAMQVYPATWSVTGQGSAQRPPLAAQWTNNVPGMNAPLAIFIRASDSRLIIKAWHAQMVAPGGTSAVRQIGVTQTSTPSAAYEWIFPQIEADPTQQVVTGTGTINVPGNAIAIPSASPMGTANCSWNFSKGATPPRAAALATTTSASPMLTNQFVPNPAGSAHTGAAGGAAGGGAASAGAQGNSTAAASAQNKFASTSNAAAGGGPGVNASGATTGAALQLAGNSSGAAAGGGAANAGAQGSSTAGGAAAGGAPSGGAQPSAGGAVQDKFGNTSSGAAGGAPGATATSTSSVPNIAAAQPVSPQPALAQPAATVTGATPNLRTPISNTPSGTPLKTKATVLAPAPVSVQMPPLQGWVDLHTHPMSNLAFAGKLFHGAPDSGPTSLMPGIEVPRNTGCRFDVPAADISEALSQDGPTDGDPFQSKCGDVVRNAFAKLIEVMTDGAQQQPGNATGYPDFTNWPRWNDISHQKMWWEWIKRARDGGLRVMIALPHNNRLLAETVLVGHPGGPISGVTDDANSADLQIREIAALVNHHTDVMELAMTSSDLYNIVKRGHIAVVLGIEVDNLGDFNDRQPVSTQMIDNEINRLYQNGVRYIFPIHVTDNVFGDTALYDDLFNVSNFRETGRFWTVGCSRPGDQVSWHSFGVPPGFPVPPGVPSPPQPPNCPGAGSSDPNATGNVNVRTPGGLTSLGQYAIKSMMKHGMIVDVDHMSNAAVETALGIAEGVPKGGYPMMSGHSGVRNTADFNKENSRTPAQLKRIACLGGMFGLGTDGAKATDWAREYAEVLSIMNSAFTPSACANTLLGPGIVAFGTDMNSLVKSPRPTMVELPPGDLPRYSDIYNANNPNNKDNPFLPVLSRSQSGTRTWDYNNDGVAHYGMFADFVRDVRLTGTPAMGGKDLVDNHLLRGADYFYRMWQKIESQKANVQ